MTGIAATSVVQCEPQIGNSGIGSVRQYDQRDNVRQTDADAHRINPHRLEESGFEYGLLAGCVQQVSHEPARQPSCGLKKHRPHILYQSGSGRAPDDQTPQRLPETSASGMCESR